MARATTCILLLISISLVACGPYEYDDPQSARTAEDMAYLTAEEKAWLEEARAQRASLSTSPAPAPTKTSTTMNQPEVNQPTSSTDLIWHPMHDPKLGMVCEYIPLPADWTVSSQGWDGPGGTMVRMEQGQRYFLQQTPYRSIDELLQQTIAPEIQKAGYQVVNTTYLPEIARQDDAAFNRTWKAFPAQANNAVACIEYEGHDGKGLGVVHFSVVQSQMGGYVLFYIHKMHTSARQYDQAKKTVLYALANTRPDQQWVNAFNQQAQARSQQASAAHQSRMAQRQSAFQASQRAAQTLSEVGDIYHETYQNTNGMRDAGHTRSIQGIQEVTTRTNPFTGQTRDIQNGNKYYYVNAQGQWFGTDNPNYNPNLDPQRNNTEWRRYQPSGNEY
jgi:hypothetical protein